RSCRSNAAACCTMKSVQTAWAASGLAWCVTGRNGIRWSGGRNPGRLSLSIILQQSGRYPLLPCWASSGGACRNQGARPEMKATICNRCCACIVDAEPVTLAIHEGARWSARSRTTVLCEACHRQFEAFLASCHQTHQDGPGEALAATVVLRWS